MKQLKTRRAETKPPHKLSGIVENCARAGDLPAASLATITRWRDASEPGALQLRPLMTRFGKPLNRVYATRPRTYPSLATAANVSAISGTQLKSLPQDTLLPVLADAMILAS